MGTAVGVSSDLKSGVIDRFRTLPMARSSILAGRTFSDLLASILCATIVLITGFVIGWRPDNGIPGVIAGLAVAVLFAYAMSWLMACVGLSVSDPESAQGIGLLVLFPIAFVSSAMVPTQGLPGWMQPIAEWNPVSAVAGVAARTVRQPEPGRVERQLPVAEPGVHGDPLERGDPRGVHPDRPCPAQGPHRRLTLRAGRLYGRKGKRSLAWRCAASTSS